MQPASPRYDPMDLGTDSFRKGLFNHSLLSRKKERELIEKHQLFNDREAFKILIKCNQKLVFRIALKCSKKYANRQANNLPLSLLDLLQHGTMGLKTAIDKFDLSRKTRLSTYATYWIEQRIKRAIENYGHVRVPVHVVELRVAISNKIRELLRQGKRISFDDLAKEMNLSPKQAIRALPQVLLSLDSLGGFLQEADDDGDGGDTYHDWFDIENNIAENTSLITVPQSADGVYELRETVRLLEKLFSKFSKRDTMILKLRFGLERYVGRVAEVMSDGRVAIKVDGVILINDWLFVEDNVSGNPPWVVEEIWPRDGSRASGFVGEGQTALVKFNRGPKDFKADMLIVGRFRQFTLQEIGDLYGISRQRVEQVEKKILEKLKKRIKREEFKELFFF